MHRTKTFEEQECIPVGCVPPACCPYLPACTGPGGCTWSQGGCTWCTWSQGGCTWSRGVGGGCTWSQGGVPSLGGCTWSRGVYLVQRGVPGPQERVGVYLVQGGCTWYGGEPGPGGVYLPRYSPAAIEFYRIDKIFRLCRILFSSLFYFQNY